MYTSFVIWIIAEEMSMYFELSWALHELLLKFWTYIHNVNALLVEN